MQRPALFAELCAGTAALSLRLENRYARPPVSRMGAKTGYADAILRVMGLRAGLGAERYLWCEPDPGCRLLLEAYRDRELAQAAADIIRSWADEEPRALWERLRDEGPPKLEPVTAWEVAAWMFVAQASYRRGQPESWFDDEEARGRPGAISALLGWSPVHFSGPAATVAVDAREVAREALLNAWAAHGKDRASYGGPGRCGDKACALTTTGAASRFDRLPAADATVTVDARAAAILALPPNTVVYLDPPYVGTTGYGHDLPRDEVVRLATQWHEAGARVYISEAEPIDIPGWHHVEITACRKGQKRTFSKQQREWLTCSHAPAWTPDEQVSLFGNNA